MPSTIRDMSQVKIASGIVWSTTEYHTCPHCERKTPHAYARVGTTWVKMPPYPCDCEGAIAKRAEFEHVPPQREDIPERFRESVKLVQTPWYLRKIKAGVGLYLFGSVGTGKTTTAYAIADALRAEGWHVEVTSLGEVKSELQDTYATKETQYALFNRLSKCSLLILDDLGKESPTQSAVELIFRILNDRYEHKRPVVITSNFSRGELAGWIGGAGYEQTARAVGSRLAEMTEVVSMGDIDRRRG